MQKKLPEPDDDSNGYEPTKESHKQATAKFYCSKIRRKHATVTS